MHALRHTCLILTLIHLLGARDVLCAQAPASFDAKAAKAALSQEAKKPRFTPKSPHDSRTYAHGEKNGVEVVQYADGQKAEHPFVELPMHFKAAGNDLADEISLANVKKAAEVLREILTADPKAGFTIQVHTSAEGDPKMNQILSEQRAGKIRELLAQILGLDVKRVGAVGFGSAYASKPPTAPENQRRQDRRVLIVRQ